MRIRVVTIASTSEKLDAWYAEHGHGSLPQGDSKVVDMQTARRLRERDRHRERRKKDDG